MSNHDELVSEMAVAEKMPMLERMKLAKKRRAQQLKGYAQYEKELSKNEGVGLKAKTTLDESNTQRKRSRKMQFTGSILLLDAAARNDVTEVQSLLISGVDPNAANEDGLTALHQCCIDGLDDMMRVLLENGAKVDSRDSELWTPLHAAATCGHINLCQQLCDHGANLLAVNGDGNMPYDLCEDGSTLDYIESEMAKRGVTQELIDQVRASTENSMLSDIQNIFNNGGDIEFRGLAGETPLHVAACNGYISVAEFLLQHSASVGVTDNDDWQPIHCATCWGQLSMVKLLLEHGADIDAKTRNGEGALVVPPASAEDASDEAPPTSDDDDYDDEMSCNNETPPASTPRQAELCEDAELRHGIMELLDELHSNPIDASLNSSSLQRRNSSARSALMRRSSLLEKDAISTKDKRDEAQRFREMMQSNMQGDADDDDDDNQTSVSVGDIDASVDHVVVSSTSADVISSNVLDGGSSPVHSSFSHVSKPSNSENQKDAPVDTEIFWQSPASSTVLVNTNEGLVPVVNNNTIASTHSVVPPDVARPSTASLSDLKKHRANQRNERLYRRRGSVESEPRPVKNSIVDSTAHEANNSKSSSSAFEKVIINFSRKHSNRYDLVSPEKRTDSCCQLM